MNTTPLFEHLKAAERQRLLTGSATRRYGKGQALFRQGERAEAVWLVLRGWVHLVRSSGEGQRARRVTLFTVTPSEMLCGVSAIDLETYTATGVAGTETEMLRIPAASFQDTLLWEPRFAVEVLRLCAGRIRHMAEQYGTMADPVATRITRVLLRLREQLGNTLPLTHRELAQMTWTTTESAIRTVRSLKRRGYVNGSRGELVIRRPSALEQILQRANGHMPGGG
jgi:CRP/FNR family transcriptional regulator